MELKPAIELLQYIPEPGNLPEDATNLDLWNNALEAKLAIKEGNARIKRLRQFYKLEP